jgi:hypothetical protein
MGNCERAVTVRGVAPLAWVRLETYGTTSELHTLKEISVYQLHPRKRDVP